MAKYNKFEDLPVWQAAKKLAVDIYKTVNSTKLAKDFGLREQMQRSAVSVSSNIAEGFERGSKQEFVQFLYVARGSCGELRSQLQIAKDVGYLSQDEPDALCGLAQDISGQINGFIEYLKSSDRVGQKHQ